MLVGSSKTRFLLKGSALLILFLIVWWFLLLDPLLFLLRVSVEDLGSLIFGTDSRGLIQETGSKDWSFRIPMELTTAPSVRQSLPPQVRAIEFDIVRSDLIAFTFSLPVFWAIHLAASGLHRGRRQLFAGTIAVAALEIVLLLVFVEISARGVAEQITQSQGDAEKWVLRFIGYLVADVIPYIGPFGIALAVNRDLRSHVFGLELRRKVDQPPEKIGDRGSRKRRVMRT